MSKARRYRLPTAKDRALDQIYSEIPRIPECSGKCWPACGPIAMSGAEWERLTAAHGQWPVIPPGKLRCPMLTAAGRCSTYGARPFICRLWGTTKELACPEGCKPERWLSTREAHALFERVMKIGGPEIYGTMPQQVRDLWAAIELQEREDRTRLIEQLRRVVNGS